MYSPGVYFCWTLMDGDSTEIYLSENTFSSFLGDNTKSPSGYWNHVKYAMMKRAGQIIFGVLVLVSCSKHTPVDASNGSTSGDSAATVITWPSPVGDVVGKITVGYKGWFACIGDGSPIDAWWHWTQDWSKIPSTTNKGMASWPDMKDYTNKYGIKFYIMYDVSGWSNMQPELKTDWTNKMKAYTSSPQYAKQNGKPVVCIWGFGFSDNNHAFTSDQCLDVINWFKQQGCYVIGGVPTHWRDQNSDSRPAFIDVYKAFNMLSPWMVGRMSTILDEDNFYINVNTPDVAFCKANGIDYQPCVLPGDLQAKQRVHGDFMWKQFYNMTRLKVQGIYISMFDEFNESNQIAKTAETQDDVPAGSGFLSLDEDGTKCSSDYYLRLTGDGGKMLKGQIPLTATRPTPTTN